jgi:alpha-beta hydrolase superfamily lysophospholipase
MLKEDKENYGGNHVFATTKAVLEGMKEASMNFKKLSTPYIIFQGGVDKYIDPFAAIDLERESQTQDKTTVIYKDMWHEVHHEAEYEEICQMSADWLNPRL